MLRLVYFSSVLDSSVVICGCTFLLEKRKIHIPKTFSNKKFRMSISRKNYWKLLIRLKEFRLVIFSQNYLPSLKLLTLLSTLKIINTHLIYSFTQLRFVWTLFFEKEILKLWLVNEIISGRYSWCNIVIQWTKIVS